MPHIQVADVAAGVDRATELGGSVLMHARNDDGESQWAVLLDPNRAAFGIIPIVPAEAISPGDAAGGWGVCVCGCSGSSRCLSGIDAGVGR